MNLNVETLITAGVALLGLGLGLYEAWARRRMQAADASESSANAVRMYSDEVVRLKEKEKADENRIKELESRLSELDKRVADLADDVRRLEAQVISLGAEPITQRRMLRPGLRSDE